MPEHSTGAMAYHEHATSARDITAYNHARVHVGHNYYTTADPSLSQRQNNVLKTLSTLPYRDRKNHNPRRVSGTCEWFLAHPLFEQWRDGPSPMLWVSADPGCGKSVLARHLVDHELNSRPQAAPESPRTTCYFFFKDGLDDQRSLQGALRCILYQLFTNRRDLFTQPILDRFESESYLLHSTRSLWELLVETTNRSDAGQVICLFDAIDECEDNGRDELYELLDDFINGQDAAHNTQLKLLLTSRPYSDIRAGLVGLPIIHLKGETEEEVNKIAGEIRLVIESEVESISTKFRISQDEKARLRRRLLDVENRTYLWAHLTLDLIRKDLRASKRHVIESSGSLPQTVEEAYERMLSKSPQPAQARKLLQIILAATRPLSLSEMAGAMVVQREVPSQVPLADQTEEDFGQYLRDLCGLLVIVGRKVTLLHHTAREFLMTGPDVGEPETATGATATSESLIWRQSISLKESHIALAEACIWSLLSTVDSEAVWFPDLPWAQNRRALDRYAAMNWHSHARKSGYQGVDLMRRLCEMPFRRGSPPSWFNAYYSSQFVAEKKRMPRVWSEGGWTPVQIASYCGLLSLVRRLLEEEDLADVISLTNSATMSGRSAVSLAATKGFSDIVKEILRHFPVPLRHLLRHNPLEVKDLEGRTPLAVAALNGHEGVVDILLREGALVDVKDNVGSSPLIFGICSGKQTVVDLLAGPVDHEGREIDEQLERLLVSAIFSNEQSIVRRVIDTKRIDLAMEVTGHFKSSDDRGRLPGYMDSGKMQWPETLLSMAFYLKKPAIAQILMDGGADLHYVGRDGLTPFHWAVIGDEHQIIQKLLALKSNPNHRIASGLTPMDMSRSFSTIQLLCKHGAVIPGLELWTDERRHCAQTIMKQCHPPVGFSLWLNELLQRGRKAHPVDFFPFLIMTLPVVCGRDDLLEAILEPGQNVNFETSLDRWRLIHFAARFESGMKCFHRLLHMGADLTCSNARGETALHLAALAGNSEVVAELQSKCKRTDYIGRSAPRTALHCAIESGSVQTVKMLLDSGEDPNCVDSFDSSPLSYATRAALGTSAYDMIGLLLAYDANPNFSGSGGTALHNVTRRMGLLGAPDLVELLLVNGADPNLRNAFGDTPLHSAASADRTFDIHGVLEVLLEHGADPTAENNRGETALTLAVRAGQDARTRSLIQQAIFSSAPQVAS